MSQPPLNSPSQPADSTTTQTETQAESQTETQTMSPVKIILSFLFLGSVWGGSFLFMRIGVPEFSAPVFAGLRVALAGLVLLPILLRKKHWQEFKAHWQKLCFNGLVSTFLPFMLFCFALMELHAGTASVINSTVPLLTGVIAHVCFKDYLSKQQMFGLSIGILGVFLLMYDGIFGGHAISFSLSSFMMALGACFCYAIGANFIKHSLKGISPITIASSGLLVSGVVAIPFIGYYYPVDASISWQAWGSAVAIAVLSTAIATVMIFEMIQQIGPTKASMTTLIVPIFGILFGIILLGESLTLTMVIGSAIVLSGTGLALFAKK